MVPGARSLGNPLPLPVLRDKWLEQRIHTCRVMNVLSGLSEAWKQKDCNAKDKEIFGIHPIWDSHRVIIFVLLYVH